MIRTLLIAITLIGSLSASTQTHRLAAKRHHMALVDPEPGPDLFGLCTQMVYRVDSIEKVNERLVVIHTTEGLTGDTRYVKQEIKDHPVYLAEDFDLPSAKATHDQRIVWIGFEEKDVDEERPAPAQENSKRDSSQATPVRKPLEQ